MQENVEARQYTYGEIGNHFKYDSTNKVFTPRSTKKTRWTDKCLTLVHNVSPAFPERFALRLLAMRCKGICSWKDLHTFNGVTYKTYTEVAEVSIYISKKLELVITNKTNCDLGERPSRYRSNLD